MDYNSLSDEELDKQLASAQKPVAKTPDKLAKDTYSNMSDADLDKELALANKQPSTIQEMHPDFTEADRLVVKNFSANNEAAVNYLQKRHPNLEISVGKNDQIKARARDGSDGGNYRVLDPDTGFFSTDILRDAGDIAYDTAAGLGTTFASGAAGVAGAGAGGVGAVPAAMAAGGASSAGLEGLRQKLGQYFGLDQKVDYGDVTGAGVAGALTPLLFGTGASAGQIAKGALQQGLEKDVIEGAQKGALSRLADTRAGKYVTEKLGNAGAKVASLLSGAPEESIKTFAGKNAQYLKMEKDPEGILNFMDETGKVVDDKFRAAKDAQWNAFNDAINGTGDAPVVDTTPVIAMFKDAIAEADAKAAGARGTEASRELGDRLKEAFNRYFMGEEKQMIPKMVEKPNGLLDEMGRPIMTQVEETTEHTVKSPNTSLSPRAAIDLEQELSDMAGFSKLKGDQVAGNRFSGGDSVVDKKLMTLGARLKETLAGQTDAVVPSNALPARRAYGELANMEKSVDKLVQNPRQAFTNLRNSDISSNITNKQLFHKIDRTVGTDLGERAKMAEAFETFSPGRKSFFSDIKKRTSIPAGIAGGALAAYSGSGGDRDSGVNMGARFVAGGAAGAMLGGPAAMRKYIQAAIKSKAGIKALPPALRNAAILKLITEPEVKKSPWSNME